MGLLFYDQYSLLHFSVGVVMYFWGFSLWWAFVIHTFLNYLKTRKWACHSSQTTLPSGQAENHFQTRTSTCSETRCFSLSVLYLRSAWTSFCNHQALFRRIQIVEKHTRRHIFFLKKKCDRADAFFLCLFEICGCVMKSEKFFRRHLSRKK
jgi:hypothetical protein